MSIDAKSTMKCARECAVISKSQTVAIINFCDRNKALLVVVAFIAISINVYLFFCCVEHRECTPRQFRLLSIINNWIIKCSMKYFPVFSLIYFIESWSFFLMSHFWFFKRFIYIFLICLIPTGTRLKCKQEKAKNELFRYEITSSAIVWML